MNHALFGITYGYHDSPIGNRLPQGHLLHYLVQNLEIYKNQKPIYGKISSDSNKLSLNKYNTFGLLLHLMKFTGNKSKYLTNGVLR